MDNKELQEFDLDDILNEFHDEVPGDASAPDADAPMAAAADDASPAEAEAGADADALNALDALLSDGEQPSDTGLDDTLLDLLGTLPQQDSLADDTLRFDVAEASSDETEADDTALLEDATIRMDDIADLSDNAEKDEDLEALIGEEVTKQAEENQPPAPQIIYNPRTRLRELKKKLVAGPEKRYYELSEQGVGRLQLAILANVIIVVLCALTTALFALGIVPDNRLRFVIFSQVLAMLVSALLGSHQMIDGLSELFRGRFTVNTLLSVTFAACCVDAVLCLIELRIPCCAAFSLEMTMALWARYQRRTTEMAQMDTLRKAVRLNSVVKVDNFYDGKSGILRGLGEVEDFMDTYNKPPIPETIQSAFSLLSMLLCFGIAAFTGISHNASLAVQILATSLLVAVPASAFVVVTRPMAILERRLHMVGTVLCGWKGIRKMGGKAVFPIRDEDLFPQGSSKLNGVKFYGDRNPDQVVSYSAALIQAAGGGLVPVFQQLRKSRSCPEYHVVNFRNYGDGGIGGEVQGEPVLLGSLQFLQDMGVEIPDGTMVNQAVYASIDGQLSAVYAISYAKMRSSSAGLVSLFGCRKLIPILTGADFTVTEGLIQSKFGVNTNRMVFPDQEVRAELARRQPTPEDPVLALATREDLVSITYAVSGARSLRTATNLGVALNIFGGILGLVIMLVLGYLGSTELLTPTNVLLYQLVWLVPSLLITEWTRIV